MDFPIGATAEERNTKWPLIGEASDRDLGFTPLSASSTVVKFRVRVLLLNDASQVCLVRSSKFNYVQLPGGEINEDESIADAARREVKEEAGCEITELQPFGYTVEHRESLQNTHTWNLAISFVFIAKAGEFTGTQYTTEEQAESFMPVWVHPNRAPILLSNSASLVKNYSGAFAAWRDTTIFNAYKAQQK